jgi:hypothetical protein
MIQDNLDKVLKHKSAGVYDLKYRNGTNDLPDNCELSRDFYDVERFVAVSIPGGCYSTPLAKEDVPDYYLGEVAVTAPVVAKHDDLDNPPDMIPADGSEEVTPSLTSDAHPIPAHLVTPRHNSRRVSVLLNVCDSVADFKLHEVVDVVGVLYAAQPGGSEVPSVDFCIEVIKMERSTKPESVDLTTDDMLVARSALKSILSRLLKGDEVAAEYLLLQLMSAQVKGNENLPALGSWTLNLGNAEDVDGSKLVSFLESCQDSPVVSLPASNEVLLTEKFYPFRAIENEFTSPGMLQLSAGTTVVIDERPLKEGNVNALNILAINKAVREQELIAVFGSSDMVNFKLDLRFVILNKAPGKSLFADSNPAYGVNGSCPFVTVNIKSANNEPCSVSDICLSPNDQELIGRYICAARELVPKVTIPEAVIEQFQTEWVEARKADSTIPVEDLDAWATLLRNVAASYGSPEVTLERLADVISIECERRQRRTPTKVLQESENQQQTAVMSGA